jgi:hypothetical protein
LFISQNCSYSLCRGITWIYGIRTFILMLIKANYVLLSSFRLHFNPILNFLLMLYFLKCMHTFSQRILLSRFSAQYVWILLFFLFLINRYTIACP